MIVDQPLVSVPHGLDEGVKEDLHEGDELGEDQPDVDHLDVGRGREGLGDGDEESGEDEECSQIDHDDSLEEEGFEEGGGVHDGKDEAGREVGGQELVHDPPLEDQGQHNPLILVT